MVLHQISCFISYLCFSKLIFIRILFHMEIPNRLSYTNTFKVFFYFFLLLPSMNMFQFVGLSFEHFAGHIMSLEHFTSFLFQPFLLLVAWKVVRALGFSETLNFLQLSLNIMQLLRSALINFLKFLAFGVFSFFLDQFGTYFTFHLTGLR